MAGSSRPLTRRTLIYLVSDYLITILFYSKKGIVSSLKIRAIQTPL